MEIDPTRVCELLVGLADVSGLGVLVERADPSRVHVEIRHARPRVRAARARWCSSTVRASSCSTCRVSASCSVGVEQAALAASEHSARDELVDRGCASNHSPSVGDDGSGGRWVTEQEGVPALVGGHRTRSTDVRDERRFGGGNLNPRALWAPQQCHPHCGDSGIRVWKDFGLMPRSGIHPQFSTSSSRSLTC